MTETAIIERIRTALENSRANGFDPDKMTPEELAEDLNRYCSDFASVEHEALVKLIQQLRETIDDRNSNH